MTVTKYRVLRDFKFNGRDFARGDAIDRDYIKSVAPHKEGTLLRTRFIDLPPTRDIDGMSKSALVDHAQAVGAEFSPSWRKDEILEAVEEATR